MASHDDKKRILKTRRGEFNRVYISIIFYICLHHFTSIRFYQILITWYHLVSFAHFHDWWGDWRDCVVIAAQLATLSPPSPWPHGSPRARTTWCVAPVLRYQRLWRNEVIMRCQFGVNLQWEVLGFLSEVREALAFLRWKHMSLIKTYPRILKRWTMCLILSNAHCLRRRGSDRNCPIGSDSQVGIAGGCYDIMHYSVDVTTMNLWSKAFTLTTYFMHVDLCPCWSFLYFPDPGFWMFLQL